jgi:peptide/nickel transport system permease protein
MPQHFARRFMHNKAAVGGLLFLSLIIFLAVTASLLFPGSPFAIDAKPILLPSREHLLGTDALGRDMATCIAYGARTSLLIGLVATLVSTSIGTAVGGLAGYYGGSLDDALMRITDFFQTIPSFLLAIVLVAILTPSIGTIMAAIAIVSWPGLAKLVRAEFLTLKTREFVEASVGLGMSDAGIIFRIILPNALSSVIVTGSAAIANAILVEAALSFLGLGDPNVMSWGFLIGASRSFLREAWWMSAIPGVAILLTVLSINLIGEGLNDALNPRLNRG